MMDKGSGAPVESDAPLHMPPAFRPSDLPTYDGILSLCPILIFDRVDSPFAELSAVSETP